MNMCMYMSMYMSVFRDLESGLSKDLKDGVKARGGTDVQIVRYAWRKESNNL